VFLQLPLTHKKEEDIIDLLAYLQPPNASEFSSFSLSYNRKAFNGWIKQYSACCGAASVAGAWNALANMHRFNTNALTAVEVLDVYKNMFIETIDKKKSSFQRKLGATIDELLSTLLPNELAKYGREIGGSKKGVNTVTKKYVMQSLKTLCRKHYTENNNALDPPLDVGIGSRHVLQCFIELFELEGYYLLIHSRTHILMWLLTQDISLIIMNLKVKMIMLLMRRL
jgi:hypothetical protein